MALSDDPEVKKRQLAAIFAKQRGTYSGGSGKSRATSHSDGVMKSTVKSVVVGAGVGATATVLPAIIPIYKAYSIAKLSKGMYDAYNRLKNKDEVFDKIMTESAKYSTSEASEKLSEDNATQFAKGVRIAVESAGIIKQIKTETGVDEDIYGTMLEGSIKNGMLSGIGNFTSYTIEGLMS